MATLIKEKLKENPIMVALSTVILAGGALSAGLSMTGTWDAWHTSTVELTTALQAHTTSPHAVSEQQRLIDRKEAKCENLAIRISIVGQQIWSMENAGENSARLVEKRRELAKLLEKEKVLHCASF